jgi:hypothetical protein
LLTETAHKHILVEDPIYIHELIGPGVVGGDLLPIYLKAHVPVALATDDEGRARSNLTQTFLRAVQGYHVDAEIWAGPERFGALGPACAGEPLRVVPSSAACRSLLAARKRGSNGGKKSPSRRSKVSTKAEG